MQSGKKVKKPKFPTKLEESMMKRKDQEFVCTCYGEEKGETSSLPSTDDELRDEAGTSRVTSTSRGTSQAGEMSQKLCPRMHIMYKTPAEVLREMDAERDRMTLMAELTDMIEKKLAKQKAALRKKKLKAKKAKKEQPNWFQELTTLQMKSTEMLGVALMADMEEGSMERTILVIRTLGLKPFPPEKVIWHVMANCYTSPVLFLLYLALCLEPKERPMDKNDEPLYAVRERILLSGLAHLLMPRTLFDLHFLLPRPQKMTKEDRRVPVEFKLKKKNIHTSPYLQPQPMLVKKQGNEMAEEICQMLMETFQKATTEETKCQNLEHRIQHTQNIIDHFKDVKDKHKLRATHSYIKIDRHFGDLQEVENTFYRQLSYLPTLLPTFPNETYPLLRYSTSTEPPDTSSEQQVLEERDQNFKPMMSLAHCAKSWDFYELSGLTGSLNPPLTHVIVDEQTPPVQIKALEGYFHAYPTLPKYNLPRLKPFIRINPLHACPFKRHLKDALKYLAQRGNPLAALPDAHLLPQIHKWILKRYRYKMSTDFENMLYSRTVIGVEKGLYKTKLVPTPRSFICKLQNHKLTWNRRVYMERLAKRVKNTFFGKIQTSLVNQAREFWPLMCMKYYDNPTFRDVFYSYVPSKQRDIYLF